MIFTLRNTGDNEIGWIKNHKDARIESVLASGDKTLYFSYPKEAEHAVKNEYYVWTENDVFVIKENTEGSQGFRNVVARLNLEDLESKLFSEFDAANVTAKECAAEALKDTGWVVDTDISSGKKRNIILSNVNAVNIIDKICEAFGCERKYDTINRRLSLRNKLGADKGVYFMRELNLVELNDSSDSYDYCTRIIPIGQDGLGIAGVNNGKDYVENYQYSSKVIPIFWEDQNYDDARALKEDAEYKLNELSKPRKAYSVKITDLANMNSNYSALQYGIGDVITLVDSDMDICEKQRIVKTVEYIENPRKNTCELSNTVLSFEEMQKKLFAAAESTSNILLGNGIIIGAKINSVNATQVRGLEEYATTRITNTELEEICK